jgi:hypothetical protein
VARIAIGHAGVKKIMEMHQKVSFLEGIIEEKEKDLM